MVRVGSGGEIFSSCTNLISQPEKTLARCVSVVCAIAQTVFEFVRQGFGSLYRYAESSLSFAVEVLDLRSRNLSDVIALFKNPVTVEAIYDLSEISKERGGLFLTELDAIEKAEVLRVARNRAEQLERDSVDLKPPSGIWVDMLCDLNAQGLPDSSRQKAEQEVRQFCDLAQLLPLFREMDQYQLILRVTASGNEVAQFRLSVLRRSILKIAEHVLQGIPVYPTLENVSIRDHTLELTEPNAHKVIATTEALVQAYQKAKEQGALKLFYETLVHLSGCFDRYAESVQTLLGRLSIQEDLIFNSSQAKTGNPQDFMYELYRVFRNHKIMEVVSREHHPVQKFQDLVAEFEQESSEWAREFRRNQMQEHLFRSWARTFLAADPFLRECLSVVNQDDLWREGIQVLEACVPGALHNPT